MKINFDDNNPKVYGTRRLFFDYLYEDLKSLGIEVSQTKTSAEHDVTIIKNSLGKAKAIRKTTEKCLIGMVHPSDINSRYSNDARMADFFITGSLEEADYYSFYNNPCFTFPHIERDWGLTKKHENKSEIVIGYHGNKMHLEEMAPRITWALEEVAKQYNIKLKAIYNRNQLGTWRKGRPKIQIEDVQWSFENLGQHLAECDIGIVPGMINPRFDPMSKISKLLSFYWRGGFQNDYQIKYKNTSNAGRAFVFMQLGIPTITDPTPECCSTIQHQENGFLCYSKEAWRKYLLELCGSVNLRTEVGLCSKKYFERNFNREDYTKRFLKFLMNDVVKH